MVPGSFEASCSTMDPMPHVPEPNIEGHERDNVGILPPGTRSSRLAERLTLFYWGILLLCFGAAMYFAGILPSLVRLALFFHNQQFREWNSAILWYSAVPATLYHRMAEFHSRNC